MRWNALLCALVVIPSALLAEPAADVTFGDAKMLLSPGVKTRCTTTTCLIEDAYLADPKAQTLALALYRDTGTVAGVGPEELMDGGYRGKIRLVPQLPLGKYRKHLTWTDGALRSIDTFFGELFANQTTGPSYRWRALSLRFVRSIKKRTPSAYAFGWTIEYNVEGSLLTSAPGVLETLFHELFHNNDFDHGDWSANTLQQDYDAIVEKCGTKAACLTPYAPNKTRVKATGTYYAFQPNNGNGVHEYAAELAVRYFTEQRQMLRDGKLAKPAFKCGPPENARSWNALITEFFAGRDLVPPC
ncbi:MAG: hypothetical protein H0T42_29880 [Deltaproteobacteria bacterium]|nr:hypothetical protein [Deltaproteobacteria bacterium]